MTHRRRKIDLLKAYKNLEKFIKHARYGCTNWKYKFACSTVESSMNWGMLCTWRSMLSLRSDRDAMGSR